MLFIFRAQQSPTVHAAQRISDIPLLVVTFCLADPSPLQSFPLPFVFKKGEEIKSGLVWHCYYTKRLSFHIINQSPLLNPPSSWPKLLNTAGHTSSFMYHLMILKTAYFLSSKFCALVFVSDHTCKLQWDREEHNSFLDLHLAAERANSLDSGGR